MDSSLRSELDALRLRAYGRSADGALSSDMVRRLEELEARARDDGLTRADEPLATPEPPPSPPASSNASRGAETRSPDTVRDRQTRPRARPSRGRLMVAFWAASVATSAAVAAAATYATVGIMPVAVSNDAPQIATLESDPAVNVPVGFFGAGASSATYEFFGLTAFETASSLMGFSSSGGDCFAIALSSDIPEGEDVQNGFSSSGPVFSGCRVGDFPATITISVDSSSPPELRGRFPGGALQFIKDGDRIGVFQGESG